jgi:hypothetical protein
MKKTKLEYQLEASLIDNCKCQYCTGMTEGKWLMNHQGIATAKPLANALSGPDMVNHPPHYNAHPSGIECISVVEHMDYNIGSAIKYLWRAGLKGKKKEDLEKAIWYIQREIGRACK